MYLMSGLGNLECYSHRDPTPVVRPEWVVDSLKAGVLLPVRSCYLARMDTTMITTSIIFHLLSCISNAVSIWQPVTCLTVSKQGRAACKSQQQTMTAPSTDSQICSLCLYSSTVRPDVQCTAAQEKALSVPTHTLPLL